jgi:voltage-gated potassium channel
VRAGILEARAMRRERWYQLIEGGFSGGRASWWIAAALVTLILLNALAVILASDPAHFSRLEQAFHAFELFSIAVFTVEYLLRAWVAPNNPRYHGRSAWQARLRYLVSPVAVTDLLAILPAYLGLLVIIDLRYLRLLRLLRLLKLTHYFRGLGIFVTVIQSEARTLLSGLITVVILVVVAASLMYGIEHIAQPDRFGSIGESLWWAVVTMTTVGYGDVTPVTPLGRFLAAIVMLLGVGIVAFPAGILAARFSEELQTRRDQLAAKLDSAMIDGSVNPAEIAELTALSRELGVSSENLERMLRAESLRHLVVPNCPHCGKKIE